MSDVGGVMFDKDVVYITVPEKQSFTRADDGEEDKDGVGERLVMRLQESCNGLGGMQNGLRLFSGGEEITEVAKDGKAGKSGRKERRRQVRQLNGSDLEDLEDDIVDGENEEEGEEDIQDADSEVEDSQLPGGSSDEEEEGF
jgi:ribosome biogenesis protein BMS1